MSTIAWVFLIVVAFVIVLAIGGVTTIWIIRVVDRMANGDGAPTRPDVSDAPATVRSGPALKILLSRLVLAAIAFLAICVVLTMLGWVLQFMNGMIDVAKSVAPAPDFVYGNLQEEETKPALPTPTGVTDRDFRDFVDADWKDMPANEWENLETSYQVKTVGPHAGAYPLPMNVSCYLGATIQTTRVASGDDLEYFTHHKQLVGQYGPKDRACPIYGSQETLLTGMKPKATGFAGALQLPGRKIPCPGALFLSVPTRTASPGENIIFNVEIVRRKDDANFVDGRYRVCDPREPKYLRAARRVPMRLKGKSPVFELHWTFIPDEPIGNGYIRTTAFTPDDYGRGGHWVQFGWFRGTDFVEVARKELRWIESDEDTDKDGYRDHYVVTSEWLNRHAAGYPVLWTVVTPGRRATVHSQLLAHVAPN